MSVVVPPPTSGTQIPDPAPLPAIPPTLAEPAVTLPTRALPLQSWNSFLRASQPIAEDTRCGGYLANVSVMKLEAWYLTLQPVQVLAAVAPSVPEYVPAPQSTHVLAVEAAVAPEYLPAPQSRQVAAVEAPDVVEYLPAPQSRQVAAAEAPDVEEYLPAPQLRQALTVEAPAVAEYLPASQLTQVLAVVAAVAEEYLPATQSAQAVPDEPGSEVSTPARMDA
jgi:hypothetical protein